MLLHIYILENDIFEKKAVKGTFSFLCKNTEKWKYIKEMNAIYNSFSRS